MPTKKRKFLLSPPESESKRRVTRSSTKADATATPDHANDVTKPEIETGTSTSTPLTKRVATSASKPKTAKSDKKDVIVESKTTTATTLTITHALVKNPISCHQYTPTPIPTSSIPSPSLIFTHGAGGTLNADAVVDFCTGFSLSHPILAFQGSMNLKARTKGFHACIDEFYSSKGVARKEKVGQRNKGKSLLLGGRSMGARAAVIAASEYLTKRKRNEEGNEQGEEDVSVQLILLSYPLQGPNHDLRDQILVDLPKSASVLFIIGDKDTMCPLDLLHETRRKMPAPSQLVVVRGADHGMHVKPASATREIGEETGRVAAGWVDGGLRGDRVCIGEEGDG